MIQEVRIKCFRSKTRMLEFALPFEAIFTSANCIQHINPYLHSSHTVLPLLLNHSILTHHITSQIHDSYTPALTPRIPPLLQTSNRTLIITSQTLLRLLSNSEEPTPVSLPSRFSFAFLDAPRLCVLDVFRLPVHRRGIRKVASFVILLRRPRRMGVARCRSGWCGSRCEDG
jgi:hypothetical protein